MAWLPGLILPAFSPEFVSSFCSCEVSLTGKMGSLPLARRSQRRPPVPLCPRSSTGRCPWNKGCHLSLKTWDIPHAERGAAAMTPGLPPAHQTVLVLLRQVKVRLSRAVGALPAPAVRPQRPRPP